MTEFQFMVPITDELTIRTILQQLSQVLSFDNSKNFWLKKRLNWIAVPLESSDHLDEEEVARLLGILQKAENKAIFAIALEHLENFPRILQVPSTVEGIEEFNRCCGHFWFALCPDHLDWVIICTKLDSFIIAGGKDFIDSFLDREVDDAFLEFRAFLMEDYFSARTKEKLLCVYKQLTERYKTAKIGETVKIAF